MMFGSALLFFMEPSEKQALESAVLKVKPKLYHRYVDDTLGIWLHGKEALDSFALHRNGFYESIQFTLELVKEGQLPLLAILIKRKEGGGRGTLRRTTYRKPNTP